MCDLMSKGGYCVEILLVDFLQASGQLLLEMNAGLDKPILMT